MAEIVGGKVTANSGATDFDKGDVKSDRVLFEAKTMKTHQKSHRIQQEWLFKVQEEALSRGKEMGILVFDFGDNRKQYFVLDQHDFQQMYTAWLEQQDKILGGIT